jgi:hypothetical protein
MLAALAGAAWYALRAGSGGEAPGAGSVVQMVKAQGVDIVVRSETGALRSGRNAFTFEFRSSEGRLVDVGTVRAAANMTMPGMVMSSGLRVAPTSTPGRYAATAEFGMAGAWQMSIEWDGPAGRGSAKFEGTVQ